MEKKKCDEALAYRLGIILYLGICRYYVLFYFETALSPHCARVTGETLHLLQDSAYQPSLIITQFPEIFLLEQSLFYIMYLASFRHSAEK